MRACFPVAHDRGLDSRVYPHFGSAPMFLIADTETRETHPVINGACEHAHGQCQPLAAMAGEQVDAVVVGGIGPGALDKLRRANIDVYWAERVTVGEVLTSIASGALEPLDVGVGAGEGIGCGGHGHGQHHGHGQGLISGIGGQHRHRHGGA